MHFLCMADKSSYTEALVSLNQQQKIYPETPAEQEDIMDVDPRPPTLQSQSSQNQILQQQGQDFGTSSPNVRNLIAFQAGPSPCGSQRNLNIASSSIPFMNVDLLINNDTPSLDRTKSYAHPQENRTVMEGRQGLKRRGSNFEAPLQPLSKVLHRSKR